MREYEVVELTRDLDNPTPDRRSRDWNKQPRLKAGSRFLVTFRERDGFTTIEASGQAYAWEAGHTELGKLIFANSGPVKPKSVRELAKVHECDVGADEILRVLLKLGRVTAEDFALVGKTIAEDETF